MTLVPALTQILSGDSDDPSRDMSNWNAIRNVVNGSLDTTNLSATAAITAAQTVFGTYVTNAAWTPGSPDGFSVAPAVVARYSRIADVVFISLRTTTPGTSNGNTFNTCVTLPYTIGQTFYAPVARAVNNGSFTSNATVLGTQGNTYVQVLLNNSVTGWTTSGDKYADMEFFYFI